MTRKYIKTLNSLLSTIRSLPRKQQTMLVGIDGCGGSGKSTMARALAALDQAVVVIEMDDFFLPSFDRPQGDWSTRPLGSDYDWRRIKDQVLVPLARDRSSRYQKYDWDTDCLVDWDDIPVGGMVIIEGIYSIRTELSQFYTFKVWVEAPRDIRLRRGLERDGVEARDRWENDWMPAEDRYRDVHRPFEYADIIVDGSATVSHDFNRQFVQLVQ